MINMVLNIEDYDAAYFGDVEESDGLKHEAGYTDYLFQVTRKDRFDEEKKDQPYNARIKKLIDKVSDKDFSDLTVLDIGGAIGPYSEYGKSLGIKSWTVMDVSDWARRHVLDGVDRFVLGDARTEIVNLKKDQYDVIFSSQFLDCMPESDIELFIKEMNRVSKYRQVHIITESANEKYYNSKTLKEWSKYPFESGTILISYDSMEVLVV